MNQHIDTTRRQLGELGAMAAQTESMERKILERAESMLADVQQKIDAVRPRALLPGADEAMQYQELVMERGRLNMVIAQARQVLGA